MDNKTDIYIEKAKKIHNNKFDYSKVKYVSSKLKVIIVCPKHGEYHQKASVHLMGRDCRKCTNEAKFCTTNKFIDKANKIHLYKYDYSKAEYKNSRSKIIINCKIHGEFLQSPNCHLNGNGCIECSRTDTEQFINNAKKIHGTRYNYEKTIYINNIDRIIIICSIHGEFTQSPGKHLGGCGCQTCGILQSVQKRKRTTEQFIKHASKIHNNRYNYTKTDYTKRKIKIIIICNIHGEFLQSPKNHIAGGGCPQCRNEQTSAMLRSTTTEFIQKAIVLHGEKYDYSMVKYIDSSTKVIIKCREHGDFEQVPLYHLGGSGCKKCGYYSIAEHHKLTLDEFILKAMKVHGDKYDYSATEYINMNTKIVIKCKKHGDFEKLPFHHTAGSGCYKCTRCPGCELWKTGGKLCYYCEPSTSNKSNKLVHKTKEMKIVNFLKEKLPNNEFIHNQSVGSDLTNKHLFPDIRFECDNYDLIVEIDEFKHRGASYACDEQRMYDIIGKLRKPCIFIRYNPDNKNSDEQTLLDIIKKNLAMEEEKGWNDYGLKVEYLFY